VIAADESAATGIRRGASSFLASASGALASRHAITA
jgi:hypothetical protein